MQLKDYAPEPDATVHHAADILATLPNKDAKVAAVHAVTQLAQRTLAGALESAIAEVIDMKRAIDGERTDAEDPAAWQAELDLALGEHALLADVAGALGAVQWDSLIVGVRLDDPDMAGSAADALAARVAAAWAPLPMHRGRWLAGLGIVAEHLEKIAAPPAAYDPIAAGEYAEPEFAPPAAANPATPGAAAPYVPSPPVLEARAAAGLPAENTGVPDADELRAAYHAWYHAGGPDMGELAPRLEVSGGTLRNWCVGDKVKPKCTAKQARVLLADIDARRAELLNAEQIFARCR